jgi:hypothetical protein
MGRVARCANERAHVGTEVRPGEIGVLRIVAFVAQGWERLEEQPPVLGLMRRVATATILCRYVTRLCQCLLYDIFMTLTA